MYVGTYSSQLLSDNTNEILIVGNYNPLLSFAFLSRRLLLVGTRAGHLAVDELNMMIHLSSTDKYVECFNASELVFFLNCKIHCCQCLADC